MADFITTYDRENNIWQGMAKKRLYETHISAGEIALTSLRSKNPNDVMQICDSENKSLTYGSALTAAIKIARYYRSINLDGDNVVGIFSPECTYVMPVALAAWFNGTPFQAINCKYELDVVRNLYNYSRPKIIFCDGLQYEKVKEASEAFNPIIYTLCNHLADVPKIEDLLQGSAEEETFCTQPLKYGDDQTMALLVSSGTTGCPKGVCVPNHTVTKDFGFANETSVMFSPSGVDWSTGLLTFMTNVMVGGIRIVTTKPFAPAYMLEIIQKYSVNFLPTSPRVMLQMLLLKDFTKASMETIKLLFVSGAKCAETHLEKIRKIVNNGIVFYGYGTTETGGVAGRFNANKPKSVGRLLPGVQITIKDQQTGQQLGPQEVGDIWVYPGYNWQGYYGNSQATAEIMDENGFIRTGDLGYMDEDNFLFLIGRCKDNLKYAGFQFSPNAIEDIIAELPDVLDVCVFGVDDEIYMDVPAAAVIKKEHSNLTEMDVIKYVEGKTEMVQYRLHYGVFFLPEFPRNLNGKVLRQKVKEMCLEMEKEKKEMTLLM